MSFGSFLQSLCLELTTNHGWVEHANALLYTNGAPELMNYILTLWEEGQTIELAAALVDSKLRMPLQ